MHRDLRIKCMLFLSVLMKLGFSQQIFEKYSNIKFYEAKLFHIGQTDMTKLTLAFRSFAEALKGE